MQEIREQIERIQKKILEKKIEVHPVATEQEINAFEEEHGITLPSGYRAFLLSIGNGGQGPGDGVEPLGKVAHSLESAKEWREFLNISIPFPLKEQWDWDEWTDEVEAIQDTLSYGNIALGYNPWKFTYHLIVTGSQRGQIWIFHEEGAMPDKQSNFLDSGMRHG